MSITLELPSQEEAWLRRRAARQGKELDSFVYDLIQHEAQQEREREAAAQPGEGQSLAETLEGLIGLVQSDGSMDARDSKKVFGNYLEEKHRSGNL